ncbi:MAG TPA: FtsX-like permease family protein [Terrimicrobiaceae bacterium]
MALPLIYNLRSIFVRWRATLATVLCTALVVAVYVVIQSLAVGLEKASGNTGDPDNLLVVRRGATAESTSQITPEQYRIIRYLGGIARDSEGFPLASSDLSLVINVPRTGGGEANAIVRGISPLGARLRTQVRLTNGRWFTPGKREVVVSERLAARLAGMGIGESFKTGPATLSVVGHFDGGRSAFDSEIWMDVDEARTIFDRENYSSVLLRPATGTRERIIAQLENDKRFKLRALSEVAYYQEQTGAVKLIRTLGSFLATTMSIGAVFAAMNTMYAAVGARTREIGTLRVLGYRRKSILAGFLIEGAFLAFLGGILGCVFSLIFNGWSVGTLSFETFSETVFDFRVTPNLIGQGLAFAVVVGLIGSLLPALRAARLPVISALKAT